MRVRNASSFLVLAFALAMTESTQSQSNTAPFDSETKVRALVAMATQPLREVITNRRQLLSLPATAGNSMVITCRYSSTPADPTSQVVRRFWYTQTPVWISKVAGTHPIRTLIVGTVEQCPANLGLANDVHSVSRPLPEASQSNTRIVLTPSSFTVTGLKNEAVLTALYLGDSDHNPMNRDTFEFQAIINAYLDSYAQRCTAYLPANKVEMKVRECAKEEVRTRYGAEVSRTCVEYRDRPTGLYADPALLSARQQVNPAATALVNADSLSGMFSSILSNAARADNAKSSAEADMNGLFAKNACTSPGLKRFQENMRRFAAGETLLLLSEGANPVHRVDTTNYTNLLEDLLIDSAGGYVGGSVSEMIVSTRDAAGNPAKIIGNFLFDGTKGRTKTSVTLEFVDGIPNCLYFFEYSNECKRANSRVVANYRNGKYRK